MNTDLHTQQTMKSLIDDRDYASSTITADKTKITTNQVNKNQSKRKKRCKRPRKQTQLKQGSAIDESPHIKEQIGDTGDGDDVDEKEGDDNDEGSIYI